MNQGKDRVGPYKAPPGFEERFKKAMEETALSLQKPPKSPLSPQCCPHCWLHEPIGF